MNKVVEFSYIPAVGKFGIMESGFLLIREFKSENKNWSESNGPCKGFGSILGCKGRCTGSAALPLQFTFSLPFMQTTLVCSRQMVLWPAMASTPSFPTTGGRTYLYHHNCMRPMPAHTCFHLSPFLVHPAQITQLTLSLSSLVHATETSPAIVTPFS